MFSNIDRTTIQIVSFLFFVSGIITYFTLGFQVGGTLMGIGFYIVIMSESSLLSRVQSEMTMALEKLNKRRENEIQDLLYFLRESKISTRPFDSLEAASIFIERLPIASIVVNPNHSVHKINKTWTKLFGWTEEDLIGKRTEHFQCPESLGPVSVELVKSFVREDYVRHSKYCYLDKSGNRILGLMVCHMFKDQSGCLAMFYPDQNNILN
jgi:PAS domain S-box-containing protein